MHRATHPKSRPVSFRDARGNAVDRKTFRRGEAYGPFVFEWLRFNFTSRSRSMHDLPTCLLTNSPGRGIAGYHFEDASRACATSSYLQTGISLEVRRTVNRRELPSLDQRRGSTRSVRTVHGTGRFPGETREHVREPLRCSSVSNLFRVQFRIRVDGRAMEKSLQSKVTRDRSEANYE